MQQQNNKYLIYGKSGVGKTCLAFQFPKPIWIADFDEKSKSGLNFLEHFYPGQEKDVHVEVFKPSIQAGAAPEWDRFAKTMLQLDQLFQSGKSPYKTVIIDSLTTVQQLMLQVAREKNPNIKAPIPGTPAQLHYMGAASFMGDQIKAIKTLPCNVVFIAHVKDKEDQQSGAITKAINAPGQLEWSLAAWCDEVYRLFTAKNKEGNLEYFIQTRPDDEYVARTQSVQMPMYTQAKYSEIHRYVHNKGKKENEK